MSALSLTINGLPFPLGPRCGPETTLLNFIRNETPFRATKTTCEVGGCGSCIVALVRHDATTGKRTVRAVHACLVHVLSLVHDPTLHVITNDGVGSAKAGYSSIQTTLADKNGTQCGHCASGFVMSLFSFLSENPNPTALQIERMLDGNICRCTGYRPILDAFTSFAGERQRGGGSHHHDDDDDAGLFPACREKNCCQKRHFARADIEDLEAVIMAEAGANQQRPQQQQQQQLNLCPTALSPTTVVSRFKKDQAIVWHDVPTLEQLGFWMTHYQGLRTMLAVGGTSQGVYKTTYDVYLNITPIPELHTTTQSPATGVTFGSTVTIADAIAYLSQCTGPTPAATAHFPQAVAHLSRIGSVGIRNRGSLCGNLVFTHQHQTTHDAFPSDAFIVLLGLGASVSVWNAATGETTTVALSAFLAHNLALRVVTSVTIPWADANANGVFSSYKIALRQVNCHALVNASMRAQIDPTSNVVVGAPTVAYGGVAVRPQRLPLTESALVGCNVTSTTAVQAVIGVLTQELQSIVNTQRPRTAYRLAVAVNYFYKFILRLCPAPLPTSLQRASQVWMERPLTQSSQTFGTKPSEYPVSLPIPKVDGLVQTSGAAVYVDDIPAPPNTLFGAVVQATQAGAPILAVDPSVAADVEGFVKYYDASSIPAARNAFNVGKLFATDHTDFAGQCIGFVVAQSQAVARNCAALIQGTVVFGQPPQPILVTVEAAVAANSAFPMFPPITVARGNVQQALAAAGKVVSGTVRIGSQYHFHMENHGVLVQPVEGGIVLDVCSQCIAGVQTTVASVLNVPVSNVLAKCRRCGGGFGAKVTASNFVAAVAAIAAQDLQLPVKFCMTLKDPQRGLGARPEYLANYSVGVTQGQITAMRIDVAIAAGYNGSDTTFEQGVFPSNVDNCYFVPNFESTATMYQTNVAPSTSVRGPEWIQSIGVSEMVMNRVAAECGIEPHSLRQQNLYADGQTTPAGTVIRNGSLMHLWGLAMEKSAFHQRRAAVQTFNNNNSFVKRGLSINPTRFGVTWGGGMFNSHIAVYAPDGSVCITHGGTEIGQGINTKVTQVCAMQLGMTAEELGLIRVLPTTTQVISGAGNNTGGSITSEMCSLSVMRACQALNARLDPLRVEGQTWAQLINAASNAGIDLTARGWASSTDNNTRYSTWGVGVSEVEVDALTGQFEIKRSDLYFDCGVSMNPAVDIGQVEGGFVFGLGWFTQEVVEWNASSGEAEFTGTWLYNPPSAYDIPEVLNVTLLEGSSNPVGVLSAKACGEPPVALAVSVVHAIEDAVNAARAEGGLPPWTCTSTPLTVDRIANACSVAPAGYIIPQ